MLHIYLKLGHYELVSYCLISSLTARVNFDWVKKLRLQAIYKLQHLHIGL